MDSRPINTELHGSSLQSRKVAAFELSERFYPPFFETPAHTHDNALFCLVLKGNYTEIHGRSTRECAPRTALFHASGDPHAEHFHDRGGHSFIVEIERPWIENLCDRFKPLSITADFRDGAIPNLGARLYEEFTRFDDVSPLIVEGLMLEIAGETARRLGERRDSKPSWLGHVENLIHDRFTERLSLAEIAACASVHPVHLAQTFRRVHGTTVGGYVKRLRLGLARRQLLASKRSIAEIALECGFSDQSHLTRRFRAEFGTTPQRFRDSAS